MFIEGGSAIDEFSARQVFRMRKIEPGTTKGTADATPLSRQELELGFVFLGGKDEVGAEFVAAFGDEILDHW